MTLTDSRIHWTDKTLARVHPRRDQTTATAPQPHPALWRDLHDRIARYLPALERGLTQTDEDSATRMRTIIEVLRARSASAPRGLLDPEIEAALGVAVGVTRCATYMYSREEQEGAQDQVEGLVAEWVRQGGLQFAVKAVMESAHWEVGRADQGGIRDYFETLVLTLQRKDQSRFSAAAFLALRKAVSVADDEQYAHARDAALAIRQGHLEEVGNDFSAGKYDAQLEQRRHMLLRERTLLSYAFPDEPWWEEDVAGAQTVPSWHWLDAIAPLTAVVQGERGPAFLQRLLELAPGAAGRLLDYLPTFLYNQGPAADQALIPLLTDPDTKDVRQGIADVLSLIETPTVADRMASLLTDKHCRAIASQYLARVPRLAAPALLRLQATRGELAEAAGILLARMARTAADELNAAPLDDAQRQLLEALCAPLVEATADELPGVLAAPPWTGAKGRAKRAPIVLSGQLVPQTGEAMAWRPLEKETLLEGRASQRGAQRSGAAATDSFDAQASSNDLLALYLLEDEAEAKRLLETLPPPSWTVPPHYQNQTASFAAAFDLALLPVLLLWADQRLAEMAPVLARYASPRVAPVLARALHELKTVRADQGAYWHHKTQPTRPLVHAWLLEHAEQAAAGLVPVAVGPLGPARDACEGALRFLAANGREAQVKAAAGASGATAAVDEVLGYDPLLALPDRLPKKPSFWKAAELPRPLLAGSGHALPLSAVEHLGTMLSFSPLSPPYAGLAEARAACDPRSLDAFAWSLFQTWLMDGAPAKDSWPLCALAHLGSDDMARRLAPFLKAWPREGGQARAVLGLDVLAQIGSDVALRVLFGIAERGRKALKEKAQQRLDELARLRGLSADDLADRLVADFDLDEDGSCALDYGPRQFRVGFDDDLKPYVLSADGTRLHDLPAAGADDDRELATAAVDQWKHIKKDARKTFTEQANRLESALVSERRWPVAEFRDNLLGHPLLIHLVRRLVWAVFDGDAPVATFMARGDALEDADERPLVLPEEARVGLVHPLHLSADEVAAWTRLLTEYEIVQPFTQMGRARKLVKETERDATSLTHLEGRTTTVPRLLGLERRGWRKGAPSRVKHSLTMMITAYEKPLQNGTILASFWFTPGFELGTNQGTTTLGPVEFRAAAAGRYGPAGLVRLGGVSPVGYSEVMADLETLKASK